MLTIAGGIILAFFAVRLLLEIEDGWVRNRASFFLWLYSRFLARAPKVSADKVG